MFLLLAFTYTRAQLMAEDNLAQEFLFCFHPKTPPIFVTSRKCVFKILKCLVQNFITVLELYSLIYSSVVRKCCFFASFVGEMLFFLDKICCLQDLVNQICLVMLRVSCAQHRCPEVLKFQMCRVALHNQLETTQFGASAHVPKEFERFQCSCLILVT